MTVPWTRTRCRDQQQPCSYPSRHKKGSIHYSESLTAHKKKSKRITRVVQRLARSGHPRGLRISSSGCCPGSTARRASSRARRSRRSADPPLPPAHRPSVISSAAAQPTSRLAQSRFSPPPQRDLPHGRRLPHRRRWASDPHDGVVEPLLEPSVAVLTEMGLGHH
jgi:hypothetical protein